MPALLNVNPTLLSKGGRIETQVVGALGKAGKHVGLSDCIRCCRRAEATGQLDQEITEQGSFERQRLPLRKASSSKALSAGVM